MKERIKRLTNKMVRVNRVINGYDQSLAGVVRSTGDVDFQFCLNDENKLRTWKYDNIKHVKDLTDG